MIVALLILIVLILLFGAAAIKGWIKSALGLGIGLILAAVVILWITSLLGEDGFLYLLGALFVLSLVLIATKEYVDRPSPAPKPNQHKYVAKPKPIAERSIDRVWGWFSEDIEQRFSDEARAQAKSLFEAGDPRGLDEFCRRECRMLVSKNKSKKDYRPSTRIRP